MKLWSHSNNGYKWPIFLNYFKLPNPYRHAYKHQSYHVPPCHSVPLAHARLYSSSRVRMGGSYVRWIYRLGLHSVSWESLAHTAELLAPLLVRSRFRSAYPSIDSEVTLVVWRIIRLGVHSKIDTQPTTSHVANLLGWINRWHLLDLSLAGSVVWSDQLMTRSITIGWDLSAQYKSVYAWWTFR